MEEDEPLSSSEAPRAPALDSVQGLSIPVAGPETPFRPTSGMSGLTTTGEHVTALQFDEEQVEIVVAPAEAGLVTVAPPPTARLLSRIGAPACT